MKSLTVCENSLVEPKEKSDIVKDNGSDKVYENKGKPDAQTVIDDAEEETNDNDDDSGADVRDKEDEGSQEEDGTDEEKKCKSVEEMENLVGKISEVMDDDSTNVSKKEVLEEEEEEEDLLKTVANCGSNGSSSDGEFPMIKEVVEERESVETSSKEVKCENDVLKNESESAEGKAVVVKADEGPGENMSVDESVEDVKSVSMNVADKEIMSATAKESTNESAGSDDVNLDECSSLSNDKREENSMEKTEESEKESSKDCGKNLRKRLSRPMPKSKKLSLLQEEERQKRMEASNESPEEKVSTSKGENENEIEMEVETMESDSEANDAKNKEEEMKNEKNENSKTNLKRNAEVNASGREAKRTKDSRNSWKLVKKRQVPSNVENDSKFAKRQKFEKQEEEEEVVDEKEMSHNSSPSSSVNENSSSSESKEESGESVSTSEKENSSKDSTNFPSSSSTEETKPKPEETTSSILSNLRGTLKSLTRSDLEELIIQKLCEVITERSTVGKLRRKAQALEQDQEKWKTKVQQLNKQIREMEVVMKKYINEVHKQTKEGVNQVVVPLKVTRSVGLQVSFLSGGSKTQKPNSSQAIACPNGVQSGGVNNSKSNSHPPIGLQSQSNIAHPSVQTRSRTGSGQKSGGIAVSVAAIATPTQRPAYPPVQNAKKSGHAKSDYGPAPSQPLTNKTVSNQVTTRGSRVGQASSPAQQQPMQNSSKVIDLTDDDDRQIDRPAIVPLRSQSTMRIVSPPLQSQNSQNSRFTYILPTGGATATGPASGQNLQVLIASPTIPPANGQQIVSMPPLLFKGGNPSQTGPQPVPQLLNPGTRIICPKPLKHPAPLPPQPLNSFQRPNAKLMPPRPALKISKVRTGIVLSWNMTLSPDHAPISSYQLFAYQEGNSPPATSLWKKVGDVKALPLPMACTLTQFMSGHKYHFAVRAVDHHSRIGPFSFPGTIVLVK